MEIKNTLAITEKHLLIIGNRSYKNMGDELILLWTVKLLLNEWKEITIAAYDPTRLKTFFHQFIDTSKITFVTEIPKGFRTRVKYIHQWKLSERKLYRKADAVIIGWGEIITEENPNAYRYRLVSLLPILKKPRYLMGGIQVPKKRFNRLLFKNILKRTKRIFARDMDTVHELKRYGHQNAEFFMDTSFFAYPRQKIRNWKLKIDLSSKEGNWKKYIVINLNKNAEQFLPEIIQDVKEYYHQWYNIVFVPVAIGKNNHYNDKKYAHDIQQWAWIKSQDFSFLNREKDFAHFTKTLAWASVVISSRLHLFLVASFLGVPTKVYPYQKKILKMQKIIENID